MTRFHPTSTLMPPEVMGMPNSGLVRVRIPSVGGDVDEYEFPVTETLLLSQQLRDAGVTVGQFRPARGERSA